MSREEAERSPAAGLKPRPTIFGASSLFESRLHYYNGAVPGAKPRKAAKPLDIDGLMAYAARILSARAQTTSELREKLRRRAAERADVDRVLAKLKEFGYLNDRRFAESFATWQRDQQGLGKTRVVRDLMARRVAPAVAREAAEAAFSKADEVGMIEQFLNRKYRGKNLGELLSAGNPDKKSISHRPIGSCAQRVLGLAIPFAC